MRGMRFGFLRLLLMAFAMLPGYGVFAADEVALAESAGTLTVTVASGAPKRASSEVVLVWGASDFGDDPAAWPNVATVASSVTTSGGEFVVPSATVAQIPTGACVRAFSVFTFTQLEYLQSTESFPSRTCASSMMPSSWVR